MEIPLTIFLTLYGIAAIIFLLLSFFLLYHAVRFGQITILNFVAMMAYAAGSLALLFFAAQFVDAHDWAQTIDLADTLGSIFY